MSRPCQARLDLDALRHNAALARQLAPAAKQLAVVKADAYGHGAVRVARVLESQADALAVACLEEAVELREAGIQAPILLLEGVFEAVELAAADRLGLWLTVANEEQLAWLEALRPAAPLHCWLKVNTGMNRLGIAATHCQEFQARLRACAGVAGDVVLYTHFASAEDLVNRATARQLEEFDALLPGVPRSAANSAGVLAWPHSHHDWVRPGYMLYGNSPMALPHANASALRPVMTLRSAVISLREVAPGDAVGYGGTWVARRASRIATVAAGYGDGYPRQAANGTPVLVNGQRAALAGRVSMDMITVDVTGLEGVRSGSEVVLWGEGLAVDEVARCAGTTGYELLTRMPPRPPRVVIAPRAA
ncbi:MAG: alanine racemase [Halioglobus sp.]|nr:alanine racemase [Halioglobus sp.]